MTMNIFDKAGVNFLSRCIYIESIRKVEHFFSTTEIKRSIKYFVSNTKNYLSKCYMSGTTLSFLCTHINPTNLHKITKGHPFFRKSN